MDGARERGGVAGPRRRLRSRDRAAHNGRVRHRLPLLAACLVASLSSGGCGPAETSPSNDAGTPIDPLSFSVKEAGPYSCGHRILEASYTPPAGLPERTVPVHIWYPSEAKEGDSPRYAGIFVDPVALEGVPLAPSPWKDGMPVLVHSHGHKGFAGNSHRLMCHFASHGWVAAAPDHVGNTLGDTPEPRPLALYLRRPLDLGATLDLLSALPAGDALAGQVDLSRVAMSGHSFGTYTAWAMAGATFDTAAIEAACAAGDVADCTPALVAAFEGGLSDSRAKVVVPMAGGKNAFFGDAGYDAAKVPVLLMTGSLDDVGAEVLFSEVSGVDLTWVDVEGGCHQLYGLGNGVLGDEECATLPDEEGFSIVNPWVLAYARVHVLGDGSAEATGIVEGKESLSDRAGVQRKGVEAGQ